MPRPHSASSEFRSSATWEDDSCKQGYIGFDRVLQGITRLNAGTLTCLGINVHLSIHIIYFSIYIHIDLSLLQAR